MYIYTCNLQHLQVVINIFDSSGTGQGIKFGIETLDIQIGACLVIGKGVSVDILW